MYLISTPYPTSVLIQILSSEYPNISAMRYPDSNFQTAIVINMTKEQAQEFVNTENAIVEEIVSFKTEEL